MAKVKTITVQIEVNADLSKADAHEKLCELLCEVEEFAYDLRIIDESTPRDCNNETSDLNDALLPKD